MSLKIDKENDALYFRLDESSIVESEEVQPGIILDFNSEGKVVGIEMLNLRLLKNTQNCHCEQSEAISFLYKSIGYRLLRRFRSSQ